MVSVMKSGYYKVTMEFTQQVHGGLWFVVLGFDLGVSICSNRFPLSHRYTFTVLYDTLKTLFLLRTLYWRALLIATLVVIICFRLA